MTPDSTVAARKSSGFRTLLLGRGVLLPPAICNALVGQLQRHAWWQFSEIGEASDSAVDRDSCRSVWCWLPEPYRRLVVRRLPVIAQSLAGGVLPPRFEEPVVLRYGQGDFFRRHKDQYDAAEHAAGRRMSLVAFLTGRGASGGFTGGELCFYLPDEKHGETCIRVPGRAGEFVVFAADVAHEVLPVATGTRMTLVSWLY
jgi:hypothetical protein